MRCRYFRFWSSHTIYYSICSRVLPLIRIFFVVLWDKGRMAKHIYQMWIIVTHLGIFPIIFKTAEEVTILFMSSPTKGTSSLNYKMHDIYLTTNVFSFTYENKIEMLDTRIYLSRLFFQKTSFLYHVYGHDVVSLKLIQYIL